MSSIDLTSLLSAVSDAAPAGPNLEGDASFAELITAAKGKPEQQFGETVIPAEEPDWRQVKRLALGVLGKTRARRVAVPLTRALMVTAGGENRSRGSRRRSRLASAQPAGSPCRTCPACSRGRTRR